jgi:hypothetical protein
VLNVGCGNRVAGNFLGLCLFLGSHGLGIPAHVGVDIRAENFSYAKSTLGGLVDFIVADARTLTKKIAGTFDVVFIEHPDLTTSPEARIKWRNIFSETHELLSETGGLILTTFWVYDQIPAQIALHRLGFKISYSGTNKYPGNQFDTSNEGETLIIDKYVILATK